MDVGFVVSKCGTGLYGFGFCAVFEDLRVDYVGSEVEDGRGLVFDVLVARFCDGSDAPLHVLSVELELSFGDVIVVLLDGLGVV